MALLISKFHILKGRNAPILRTEIQGVKGIWAQLGRGQQSGIPGSQIPDFLYMNPKSQSQIFKTNPKSQSQIPDFQNQIPIPAGSMLDKIIISDLNFRGKKGSRKGKQMSDPYS